MKIVLLNGPPRSGKDTIGRILWDLVPGAVCLKFAEPIVEFMLTNYSIRMEHVDKDKPHEALHGRTPREAAIAYSERFCKPLFGVDYLGRRAVQAIEKMVKLEQTVCIFTDSGFVHEAGPVAAAFGSGNVLQIRLHRLGTTFQGDSRSYWDLAGIGQLEFENDVKTIPELRTKLAADIVPEIKKWLTL